MKKLVTMNNWWSSGLILILLMISLGTPAQERPGDIIPGQMIVQLKDVLDLPAIERSMRYSGLKTTRILSARLHIVLMEYENRTLDQDAVLAQLKQQPQVINAQHNHIIELRGAQETQPDDALFGSQWNMHNTGQNSGTPGADIDALRAWDITTGGVTVLGDTIVVAVIDGGIELAHEDLNVFVNRQEIPNNGIDDDGNGYIDDYFGWNAYDDSPSQPSSNHATHVAGIIGAKGNNGIGVSGVNWNVKTLSVAGSSSIEATVVAAYSYVYEMRSLYDETNGEKGAFVVAINGSFGVNFGQPANYPIWEAMIDSLGAIGVLTAGATANLDTDVDENGDIPTAFETPYLISVTNTTKTDALYFIAGYGKNSIDLGAPGTLITSSLLGNTYNVRTGTSMATPHVAGTIALLFSAADLVFMTNYKNNPGDFALLMKQYILDGVDTIPSLKNKTVTGGRLNAYNALMNLLSAPRMQTNPSQLTASMLAGSSLTLDLNVTNSGGDTLNYTIEIIDEPGWISLGAYQGMLPAGMSETVPVEMNTNGLDTGFYACTLRLVSEESGYVDIPVTLEVYTDVGVDEMLSVNNMVAIPNPTDGKTRFIVPGLATSGVSYFEIRDISGRVVFNKTFGQYHHQSNFIDWKGTDNRGNELPDGLYLVSFLNGNRKYNTKLIINR
jgi:subtilisin family serine protease